MKTLCRWGCLCVLLVVAACEWTSQPASSPDSTTVAGAADTATVDSATVDSLPFSAVPIDTAAAQTDASSTAPSAAASPDSLTLLLRSLRTEVQRLQAVQGSLRTMLNPAPSARADTSADAAADTSEAAETTLREARDTAQYFGLRLFGAVLVLVATYFVVRGMTYVLDLLAERSAERRLLYKRIVPIARVLLWTVSLYVVLRGIFNVDAQGLLAAATAIGVAVGFAAQDLLKNIFGGLVVIFDQPFQVGDKIQIGDNYGEVVSIGLRSMRIVTPGDNLVSVPNAQVVDSAVSNANAGALDCQVTTDLYLPGDANEQLAKKLAYQAAASAQFVYLEKPIVVMVVDEWQERHRLHLKVKAYVLDARHEFRLASEVTERARNAFRAHGLLPPSSPAPAPSNGTSNGTSSSDSPPPVS